jgi:hypothetical protein
VPINVPNVPLKKITVNHVLLIDSNQTVIVQLKHMMTERTENVLHVVINVQHVLALLIIVINVSYQESKSQNVAVQKVTMMMERARTVNNVTTDVKNVKTMTENVLNVLKIVLELKNQIVIVTLLKVISILKVKKNVENVTKNVKLVKTKLHVSNVLKEEKIIHQHVLVQMMNMKMMTETVNHVPSNVKAVLILQIIVLNVLKTELKNQLVIVQMVIITIKEPKIKNVQNVLKLVLFVKMTKIIV